MARMSASKVLMTVLRRWLLTVLREKGCHDAFRPQGPDHRRQPRGGRVVRRGRPRPAGFDRLRRGA